MDQPELDLGVEPCIEPAAEAIARQSLACFAGDKSKALRWVESNIEYVHGQWLVKVTDWENGLKDWLARGHPEAGFRPKPGYPNAKRAVLRRVKDILEAE